MVLRRKCNGAKSVTEASERYIYISLVGERSNCVEGRPEGLLERLEVTMPVLVAKRRVRIPSAESLRIPEEGSSSQGKSGPKARPKGVVDGQQVDIPVPPSIV